MNKEFFEVGAKYAKITEDGKEKMVTEKYLVSAISLSDSETVITKELKPYISGEFLAVSSKYAKYADIIRDDNGERWFKAKLVFTEGTDRKMIGSILVQAEDIESGFKNIKTRFAQSVFDFEVKNISESDIIDVLADDTNS